MKQRIITAGILIAVILALLLLVPKLVPYCLLGILLLACYEWNHINALPQKTPAALLCYSVALFTYGLGYWLSETVFYLAVFSVLWYLISIYWIANFEKTTSPESSSAIRQTSPLLQGILGGLLLASFVLNVNFILLAYGLKALLLVIFIVAVADSGAYFCGRAWGRHLLSPKTSPKKTIEGLLGGLILSMVGAFAWHLWVGSNVFMSLGLMLLLSLCLALFSVVGDLYESQLKRQHGIKDSGWILPGHGGILDRIDGLMPAMAFFTVLVYFLYRF